MCIFCVCPEVYRAVYGGVLLCVPYRTAIVIVYIMATKEAILQYLDQHGELETLTYAARIGEDHQKVVGIIKSLHSFDQVSCFSG